MAAAWAGAAQTIEADYKVPFLAHATMEPPGATISIAGDRVKLIASLQSPGGASRMINAITGISRLNIDIELPRSGGGFGRRLENDFVAEAVLVAQAVGKPVKLIWTRDDDLQNDFYRPFGVQRLRAALNANGKVDRLVASRGRHLAQVPRRSRRRSGLGGHAGRRRLPGGLRA